jgi:hypothetical protein
LNGSPSDGRRSGGRVLGYRQVEGEFVLFRSDADFLFRGYAVNTLEAYVAPTALEFSTTKISANATLNTHAVERCPSNPLIDDAASAAASGGCVRLEDVCVVRFFSEFVDSLAKLLD